MPYIDGQRVTITAGTYAGRKATVIADEQAGRVAVVVDGVASGGIRSYAAGSVKADIIVPPLPPPPPPDESQFRTLVLDEQWATFDPTRWGTYEGEGHAGNGLRKSDRWSVRPDVQGANGLCLVGEARWADRASAFPLIPPWLSDATKKRLADMIAADGGAMLTPGMGHKRGFMQGRFEVRMRTEIDPTGITASNFLMWPDQYLDSPYEEVNVWETTGGGNPARTPMHSYFHFGTVGPGKPAGDQVAWDWPDLRGDEWHTITYERTASLLTVSVDGGEPRKMADTRALPKRAHHVCLQLDALWNAAVRAPVRLYVDSVKVWQ